MVERVRRGHVGDHGADVDLGRCKIIFSLEGFGDRHFLQQGGQVDDRVLRAQKRGDGVGLAADRSHLGQIGHCFVHVEELGDPPGRWRIQHDRVVGAGPVLDQPARDLVDLAGEQDVLQPWCDRGREVDHAEPVQRLAGDAEVVVGLQILHQRVVRIHRQAMYGAAGGCLDQPTFAGIAERIDVEQLGDPLAPFHLAQQHPPTPSGKGTGQRAGNRGLAGAALATDDVQCVPRSVGRGRSQPGRAQLGGHDRCRPVRRR